MAPRRLIPWLAAVAFTAGATAGPGPAAIGEIGGTTLQVQQAPWAVLVQQSVGRSGLSCSGSVIDASHVVTAAHCVFDEAGVEAGPSQLLVRAGVSNYISPLSTDAEQDRSVSAIRVHPGYVPHDEPADDVAVLELSTPLDLSGPAVQPVALPTAGSPFPAAAAALVVGFGTEQDGTNPTGALHSLTMSIDAQGVCGPANQGLIPENGIVMCASSSTGATCNGDSGAGLVTTTGTPTLVGLTSTGADGCPVGSPSEFTYLGAPEILDFVEGNDTPPLAPHPASTTFVRMTWEAPLVVGSTLSCSSGNWPASPRLSYSFWNATNGQALQTGTSPSYLVPASALGATIYCEVSASSAGGTTLAETQPAGAVSAAPKAVLTPVAPLVAAPGGRLAVNVTLRSPAGLWGRVQVCVTLPAAVGGRVCHSARNSDGAASAYPFRFAFKLRATAPAGAAHIAIAAIAGVSSVSSSARLRVT